MTLTQAWLYSYIHGIDLPTSTILSPSVRAFVSQGDLSRSVILSTEAVEEARGIPWSWVLRTTQKANYRAWTPYPSQTTGARDGSVP